jgi:hypothetical protein
MGRVDQVLDQVGDPVDAALADALARASASGQWGVVETLARELGARRAARAGSEMGDVVVLNERRRGVR